MSGAFGWSNNSNSDNTNTHGGYSYDSAKESYQKPSNPTSSPVTVIGSSPKINPIPISGSPWEKRKIANPVQSNITFPNALHSLKSTASNVLIISLDVTGSMRSWIDEIFRRLPLLYKEICSYLDSEELDLLFIAHGDARTDCFPIQISKFGRGAELDTILSSFYTKCNGGGQGDESHELVAYYLLKQVDVSSAQNVFAFFITDEAACSILDPDLVKEHLKLDYDIELKETIEIFDCLKRRMQIFTVLCETNNPTYNVSAIKTHWENNLGKTNVIPLNDSRRVVDVILGTVAKLTGQIDNFTKNLTTRQQGSQFADINITTIQKSLSLIGNTISQPSKKVESLLKK